MSDRYKLLSPLGTLLGTITFPDFVEEHLLRRLKENGLGVMSFHAPTPEQRADFHVYGPEANVPDVTAVGTLKMRYVRRYGEPCVELIGITMSHFEQLPGCTVTLSVSYMETLLRGV